MKRKRIAIRTIPGLVVTVWALGSSLALGQTGSYPSASSWDNSPWESSFEYVVSLPTAGTHDFLQNVSFRGFGLEILKGVGEQASVGLSARWVYFTETNENQTITSDLITLTGNQYLSVDSVPLYLHGRYTFANGRTFSPDRQVSPYVGAGLGPMYGRRRNQLGVFADDQYGWQFGFNVEAGAKVRLGGGVTGLLLGARYDAGIGTDGIDAISYIGLNIGFMQGF